MLHLRSILRLATTASIAVVCGIEASFADEVQWGYVDDTGGARSLETLKVKESISERIIVLVGKDSESSSAGLDRYPVVAIDTDSVERADSDSLSNSERMAVPALREVIWPDKDDRILVVKPESLAVPSTSVPRNPWERESDKAHLSTSMEFSCGGIVIGGESGPVALLNSRIVRVGDILQGFNVREIVQEGVVLGFYASCCMVPKGRRAIITTPRN
jgi:hypothetical protein